MFSEEGGPTKTAVMYTRDSALPTPGAITEARARVRSTSSPAGIGGTLDGEASVRNTSSRADIDDILDAASVQSKSEMDLGSKAVDWGSSVQAPERTFLPNKQQERANEDECVDLLTEPQEPASKQTGWEVLNAPDLPWHVGSLSPTCPELAIVDTSTELVHGLDSPPFRTQTGGTSSPRSLELPAEHARVEDDHEDDHEDDYVLTWARGTLTSGPWATPIPNIDEVTPSGGV